MENTTRVSISTIDEILTAVPHLLGFYPANCLVLMNFHDHPGEQARLGATTRITLPAPHQYTDFVDFLLTGPLQTLGPDAVALVLLTHAEDDGEELPYHQLITDLEAALTATGIPVLQAVWAPEIRHGAEWASYLDTNLGGVVDDPRASVLGLELAAQGQFVFDSREQMCSLIAPEDNGATAHRWAIQLDGLALDSPEPPDAVEDRVQTINAAIDGIANDQYPDEDTLVRILHWLQDARVRDAMMPSIVGTNTHSAEKLWIALVRKAPAPELADAAALLTLSTYLRGEGAFARIVVTRALESNPEHTLANLLQQALDHGIPPGDLANVLTDSTEP